MSLDALVVVPSWRRFAACRGQGTLFTPSDPMSQAIAVNSCSGCGVRQQCAEEAAVEELDQPFVFGVRGGLTASERRMAQVAAGCPDSRRPGRVALTAVQRSAE